MPMRHTRLSDTSTEITAGLERIRTELALPDAFPEAVEKEASAAVAALALPDADLTDIEFVTIDPEGSRDLDQALHIAPDGDGHVVHYAIADLPAVVAPGGAVDTESHVRGQTLYAPDGSVPLHPRIISEDGASLREGRVRSAYVWQMTLDADGNTTHTTVRRARVRSRSQLSYREAQERIAASDGLLSPLRTVGERRLALETARGGASLDMPEEEIVHAHGFWRIERRDLLPVEQWNAQISLMTGMEAANIQLAAGAGIIRTMPRPAAADIDLFRAQVAALGLVWAEGQTYGEFLRGLDRDRPTTLAVLSAARRLFRGAGYRVIDGPLAEADAVHAAIGAPYAHATAPLRRLVDRYALAHCEAQANGEPVPAWASAGLAELPGIMQRTGQLAGRLERESLDVVTDAILAPLVGHRFDAIVIEQRGDKPARIELVAPPLETDARVAAPAGTRIRVRLDSFDAEKGQPTFVAADD
ncbi:RNB domain-containing ribonuclease [Microbacterium nymphoidis]|uniref:RNB domain-containing ribonuclease n=1 Tax=Microbacterium nymphoidis TaxID=2898586 RepID=UPI001E593396|nr:RNB domain-containing ribonuclease [Microbacterium nymphoidis]MCD2499266.1 RNB domain-containing ribonuclease [Microbacterium nymphoidis]